MTLRKITPYLWYAKDAVEAAKFYCSIFPDSRIVRTWTMAAETPSGPPGTVEVVEFMLFGQNFSAFSAGPLDEFNHAVSFMVECEDQREVDRYWDALVKDGGSHQPCGWLKDKYGLSWQITPRVLNEWMADSNRDKAKRVTQAMLKMQKLDIAELKKAYEG